MRITTGAIITGSGQIAPNSVTETDIFNGSITLAKLAHPFIAPPRTWNNINFGDGSAGNVVMGFSDDFRKTAFVTSGTTFVVVDYANGKLQTRTGTSDYAAADNISGLVIIGLYLYVLYQDIAGPFAFKVFRYLLTDLTSSPTEMTIATQALGTQNVNPYMTSDGTSFYFTHDAMNDASNTHEIAKYSLSGTTLTYVSTITCGASATNFGRFAVRVADGHIVGINSSDRLLRRYNTSGTLQATGTVAPTGNFQWWGVNLVSDYIYSGDANISGKIDYVLCPIP